MKKIFSFFAVAAMLSMAFACTKPENEDPKKDDNKDTDPVETTITEITATLEGAATKTAWAAGDAVIVYAVTEGGDLSAKYVLSAGAGTTSGTFAVEGTALPTGATAYYASYPYSSIVFAQHNTFSFTLEAEQTASNPIFGTTTNNGKAFKFSTPLAGIEIKITGKGNAARIALEDKNTSNIINGNVEFNAMTGKMKLKNSSSSKNTVTKAFETITLGTEPSSFFFEVPAGTLETGASLLVYNPANGMIGKADIPAQTLAAGSLTTIGPIALEEVTSVAELSSVESANCYMITEPGSYKFRTVRGNSPESVGTVATAEILWESYCNNETVVANSVIAEVSYANDYVTFKTPASLHKGNALIAVKDATGAILWSWHIWVVGDMTIAGTTLGFEGTAELMNYNLGAVGEPGTVEGVGLLYAWGRKDPFLSVGDFTEKTIATVSGTAVSNTEAVGTVTSEYATANPTQWVLVTGSDGMKDWLAPSDDTRWATTKGMHDPCPAGWRVAGKDEHGLFNFDSASKNEEGTIITVNKDYKLPAGNCKTYTSGSISDDTKYFTASGSGEYGYAWRVKSNKYEKRRKAEGCYVRCLKVVPVTE